MSTTITIYFSESPFRLVLLVGKSSRSDQFVNSQKKENDNTASNLQPRNKSRNNASNPRPINKNFRCRGSRALCRVASSVLSFESPFCHTYFPVFSVDSNWCPFVPSPHPIFWIGGEIRRAIGTFFLLPIDIIVFTFEKRSPLVTIIVSFFKRSQGIRTGVL